MASRKSRARGNRTRPLQRPVPQRPVPQRPVPKSGPAGASGLTEKDAAGLKPKAAADERIEDIAVFSNAGREQLSDELKADCMAVIGALDRVYEGGYAQANDGLKSIARSSPYADWRLFLRGLGGFYSGDRETARQNWQRLDATRRPARIAATLLMAEFGESLPRLVQRPKRLVDAAKSLLHRSSAIAAAKQILAAKQRAPEAGFSRAQITMLVNLRDDFRKVDKDFVASFSQACVYLACTLDSPESFMLLKRAIPGPAHDPSWNLQEFLYMKSYDDTEADRRQTADLYIKSDLPKIAQFSPEQRGALESCIRVDLATSEMQVAAQSGFPFSFAFSTPDYKSIEKHLSAATLAYPANAEAHKRLIELLRKQLDARRTLTKAAIKAINTQWIKALESFVNAFPNEIEATLYLVDHYFEEKEFAKANALTEQISKQRLEAPLAKALPWKVKLRESMNLSRTKSGLAAAGQTLTAAEALWPSWFERSWLPFLQAALALRRGSRPQFETLDAAARQAIGVSRMVGDFMTFAALQHMHTPSPTLKPFRDAVTKHMSEAEQQSLTDLLTLGAFFWQLVRTGLKHKAYRLQASKLGKALCAKMKGSPIPPRDDSLLDACCWCASHGFWTTGYDFKQPAWANAISSTEPRVAASVVDWLLNNCFSSRLVVKNRALVDLLRASARTERDPFYRYRFDQLATNATEAMVAYESKREAYSSSGSSAAQFDDDDDDYDYEDDADSIDEDTCDCADCVSRRARAAAKNAQATRKAARNAVPKALQTAFEFGDDLAEDEFFESTDECDDETGESADSQRSATYGPFSRNIVERLGPDGMQIVDSALELAALGNGTRYERADAATRMLVELFERRGLTAIEAAEFFVAFFKCSQNFAGSEAAFSQPTFGSPTESPTESPTGPNLGPPTEPPGAPQVGPKTLEQRRAADKQRRRELEKKRQRR